MRLCRDPGVPGAPVSRASWFARTLGVGLHVVDADGLVGGGPHVGRQVVGDVHAVGAVEQAATGRDACWLWIVSVRIGSASKSSTWQSTAARIRNSTTRQR